MKLHLRLAEVRAGWLTGAVAAGETEVEFAVSYLTDAPGDLAEAAASLLNGAPEARCAWFAEPAEYRWVFQREDDRVRIQLLEFREWPSHQDGEQGKRLLETECSLLRLGNQVRGALRELLGRTTPAAYEREWRHPFPLGALRKLEEAAAAR